jgi:predicted ATPase
LEAVASLADAIIHSCADVHMLATSRQALDIAGEAVFRLPSLATPEKLAGLQTSEALQYGAIALFVDRAKAADSRFTLTDDNAPIAAEICRRLDGIPLAIELAAARVKLLALPNLAQRLNERFKILTGGSRSALPRQKTLGALIGWSYDLLKPAEQTLFNRVGIFAGGFSLDAATAVCSGDGVDEIDILDLLSSLADKSLVVADTGGEQERYRMLESTRAYALDKLTAAGARERLARRHAEYFRDQAREADERFGTGSTLAWFAGVELELDNYRTALEWGLSQGNDAVVGAAIAGALEPLWFRGGLAVEGRYWIEPALEHVSVAESPQVAARLWRALGRLYSAKRTCEVANRAVSLYESVGDGHGAARSLVHLAFGLFQMGRLGEASETNMRALAALRGRGDKSAVARCLTQQGGISYSQGAIAEGRDLFAQALAAYRALGDELGSTVVLGNLGELEFADGHPEQALRSVSEALQMDSRRGVDAINLAVYHSNSAAYRIALGDTDGARTFAREGLSFARQAQAAYLIETSLQHFALLMALLGRTQGAARLLGYVDVQLKELGVKRELTEEWGYQKLTALLRERLSEAEITKLAAEGAEWSEDQVIEEALKV